MPHSGPHFLRISCDLVPKKSILGAPWRPAGAQMAPKIGQLAPKMSKWRQKPSKNQVLVPPWSAFLVNVLNPQNYYV